jgi:prophage antirepressor-like protein
MNNIQIFKNQEFGAIRTISNEQGEVMFCAKDVCDALGYKKASNAIALHVDKGDALKQGTPTSSGVQMMLYVNESGLYSLILSSKLDSAKRFKHWVTSEVLPSIRKQGGYMVARPEETDEEVLARALQIMQAAIQVRDEEIARLQPRADYADEVLDSVTCITTTQLAKELGMTAQELNRRLCAMRIQYWQSGQYMLYAEFARQGFAKSRTHKRVLKHGMVLTEIYLVWTERGRDFIHRLLDKRLAS